MDHKTYKQEVKKIRSAIYRTAANEVQNLGLLGTYSLVSANLLRFLNISDVHHYKLIQDIQFHRSLSNIDQYCLHTLDELKVRDKTGVFDAPSEKGHVFVTFHTGSFRLFIQHLNRKGLPFCLVTEGKYIKDQGETTQKLFQMVNAENKGLEILEAENPRLLFELLRKINSGISVVFYIDGNTGVTEKALGENKNLLKIKFLEHNIYARQGIAMLAYLSKARLITAIAKRNRNLTNTIVMKALDTSRYAHMTRDDFARSVTSALFGELEKLLRKFPEQWEGWFYIQKFFEPDQPATAGKPSEENYGREKNITVAVDPHVQLIKFDADNVFVIKKRDYQVMKITPMLYEVLDHFTQPKNIVTHTDILVNDHNVGWDFVAELIEMNLLSA